MQPISGLVLAALLLDEGLTPELLAAAALVLAGIAIAQRGALAVDRRWTLRDLAQPPVSTS